MRIKKIFSGVVRGVMVCWSSGCEEKVDIVGLGERSLESVDELERLLNEVGMLFERENEFEMVCKNM